MAGDGGVFLARGVRSPLLNQEGKTGEGEDYAQEIIYLERYQAGAWQALPANTYPSQDDKRNSYDYQQMSILEGDMALDAEGNAYLAWVDNGEAWDILDTSPRLRTTAVVSTTAAPQVTKHYYASGQRIATRVNGDLYYVLGDHLGSTSLVADDQGNEVGHVIYDAFGRIVENTVPLTLTDRLFTGQVFDASTGLYYYNARYYDPQLGQFTQPDSIVADPLNPAAWNRFSYVHNAPTNYVDPSGHFAIAAPLLLIAGGVLAGELLYANHLQRSGGQANLNDLLTYMAWGGVAGAFGAAVAYGGVAAVGGATFGNLFMAGFTTGAANVIITGLEQGRFEPKEAGDAFLSGFYSSYGLSLVTNAIAAVPLFRLSRSMAGKALVYGALGSGYEAVTKGESKFPNVLGNFLIYSFSGLTSPTVGNASTKIAMRLFGVGPLSSDLYPAVPFLVDRLATGLGYGLSATTQTAVDSSMIEMYRQETTKAWQWFVAH